MPKKLLTKGVLRFDGEDGRAREVEVALFSDETYSLVEPAKKSVERERPGLFQPARQLPASVAHEALANVVRRRLEEGRGA